MTRIGITGHRNLDQRFVKKYRETVFKQLAKLKQKHSNIILYSALADGADRLVVYEAMKLDIKFIAVLPMDKKLYKDDFDATSTIDFEILLKQANDIILLTHQKPFSKDVQYELAGQYISDNSDILFAMWDGNYNNLQGGTSNTIKYHLSKNKHLLYLKVDRNAI